MSNPEAKKYSRCPKCNSIFVDFDYKQDRYRCLMWDCGWIEEDPESTPAFPCVGEEKKAFMERHPD
jgi:hypothetical protein